MPVNLVVLSKASNIGRSRTFQKREEAIKKAEVFMINDQKLLLRP